MFFLPRKVAHAWALVSMAMLLQAAPKPLSQPRLELRDAGLAPRMIAVCQDTSQGRLDILSVTAVRLEPKAPLLQKLNSSSKGSGRRPQETIFVLATTSYWDIKPPVLVEAFDFEPWGLIRLTKDKAELSRDAGQTWTQASQDKDGVVFPVENHLIRFTPCPAGFSPDRVQCLAFSGAKVPKFAEGADNLSGAKGSYPVSTDGILALAFSANEATGVFKLPLRDWIIPIKGVRVEGRWILSSLKAFPLSGSYVFRPGRAAWEAGDRPGIHGTAPAMLRMELREDGLDIGFSRQKWAQPSRGLMEALEVGMVIPKTGLHPLPMLEEQFRVRWNQALWLNASEPESFCSAADAAYRACGFSLHVPPPYTAAPARSGDWDRNAKAIVEPLLRAAQASGTRVAPLPLPHTP